MTLIIEMHKLFSNILINEMFLSSVFCLYGGCWRKINGGLHLPLLSSKNSSSLPQNTAPKKLQVQAFLPLIRFFTMRNICIMSASWVALLSISFGKYDAKRRQAGRFLKVKELHKNWYAAECRFFLNAQTWMLSCQIPPNELQNHVNGQNQDQIPFVKY